MRNCKTVTPSELLAKDIEKNLGVYFEPEPGGIQRFAPPDKPQHKKSCWVYFSEDECFARYGDFATGQTFDWHRDEFQAANSYCDHEANRVIQEKLAEERTAGQSKAARMANLLVEECPPADIDHPYLVSKNVGPHDLLQNGDELIVPMQDCDGSIRNVQRIFLNGAKAFWKGGEIQGLFAVIGDLANSSKIYITEGWATGSTIAEETGCNVAVAMNAGNLLPVCQSLRNKFGYSIELIVAADNDHLTEGNPGRTKGLAAAEAISGKFVYPGLPCSSADCRCTDFNDYHNCDRRKGDCHE